MTDYNDISYTEQSGIATVTINRPDSLNALRVATYEEIVDALLLAGWNKAIGVVVLTGAGSRAFCVGADTSQPKSERHGRGILGVALERIHGAIRDIPLSRFTSAVMKRAKPRPRSRKCGGRYFARKAFD